MRKMLIGIPIVLSAGLVFALLISKDVATAAPPPASVTSSLEAKSIRFVGLRSDQEGLVKLSASEALDRAKEENGEAEGGYEVYLGAFSDLHARRGGPDTPLLLADIPSYAVLFKGVALGMHNPAFLDPNYQPGQEATRINTSQVVFISAEDGSFLRSTTI